MHIQYILYQSPVGSQNSRYSSASERQSSNKSLKRQLLDNLKSEINAQFPGDDIQIKQLREMLIHEKLKALELQIKQQQFLLESNNVRQSLERLTHDIAEMENEMMEKLIDFEQEDEVREYEEISRSLNGEKPQTAQLQLIMGVQDSQTELVDIPQNDVYGLLDIQIDDIPTLIAQQPANCQKCKLDISQGDQYYQLSCSHTFHQPCLRNELRKKACCPSCQANLTLFDLLGRQ